MGLLDFLGGSAPDAVKLEQTDFQEEQRRAVRGNVEAMPDIEELVSRSNRFSQGQALDIIEQAVPGFANMQQRFMDLSTDLLDNAYNLPPEVTANLERQAAERGISIGGKGQFQDFSLLRDFGINQLEYGMQRQQQALNTFQSIVAQSPRINPLSPASMFVSPQEQAQLTFQQNQANQQIAQGAANARAEARNNAIGNIMSTVATVAGAALTGGASLGVQGAAGALPGMRGGGSAASGGGPVGLSFYQPQNLNVNPQLF